MRVNTALLVYKFFRVPIKAEYSFSHQKNSRITANSGIFVFMIFCLNLFSLIKVR
jgi:hypothetical protein